MQIIKPIITVTNYHCIISINDNSNTLSHAVKNILKYIYVKIVIFKTEIIKLRSKTEIFMLLLCHKVLRRQLMSLYINVPFVLVKKNTYTI